MNGATRSIDALDGVRGIAVLMVVVYHILFQVMTDPSTSEQTHAFLQATLPSWGVGATGVQLFFVLSGFLLFLPYARSLLGLQAAPKTTRFYVRRMLRILPAYWASLLLIIVFIEPTYLDPSQWQHVLVHFFLVHNMAADQSIYGVYWTMAIECQFYLLLPATAALLSWFARWRGLRWTYALVLLLMVVSPMYTLSVVAAKHFSAFLFSYRDIVSVLDHISTFAAGILCSMIYVTATGSQISPERRLRIRNASRKVAVAGFVLLAAYIAASQLMLPIRGLDRLFHNSFFGAVYGSLILGALLGWVSWSRYLSGYGLRFLGAISYSLYIWHAILLSQYIMPLSGRGGTDLAVIALTILLVVIVVVPFSLLFYHLFERPFVRTRRRQRDFRSEADTPQPPWSRATAD